MNPADPTAAPPGTPEKVEVMAERAGLRLPLFVAGDAGWEALARLQGAQDLAAGGGGENEEEDGE